MRTPMFLAAVGAIALSIDSPWKAPQHNPSRVVHHRNHKKKMQQKMSQKSRRRNRK